MCVLRRPLHGAVAILDSRDRVLRNDKNNMAIKNISTRTQICGRGAGGRGGHSAVEQSSYICRQQMYCEYDGQTYYPKYCEDLVYSEVLIPDNAPKEYKDPKVLWNAVEKNEKSINAQLARTFRVQLPNEWSYKISVDVMRDYVKRNFVDKGMCVQYAIHDSENKEGQRNLHCHMLITLRGIDEQGKWLPKQKKIYLLDDAGNKIPIIDKKTGLQKVDARNRKQWKCTSIPTNDWNSKENARMWRKDIVDTINIVNAKIGFNDNVWEYRSFKEQGLDIIPQIHLGEKSSAMERSGIKTIRGNINRKIIEHNVKILKAKGEYEQAKAIVRMLGEKIKTLSQSIGTDIKNEIITMIRNAAKKNSNRLRLPIIGSKYLRYVSNRQELQDKERMETFVHDMGLSSFEDMETLKRDNIDSFERCKKKLEQTDNRIDYLESLLVTYRNYEPYIKNHKEQWALKGIKRLQYERKYNDELWHYESYRKVLKEKILEADKKITPNRWKEELNALYEQKDIIEANYEDVVAILASVEVLEHNKFVLEQEIGNVKRNEQNKQHSHRTRENIL